MSSAARRLALFVALLRADALLVPSQPRRIVSYRAAAPVMIDGSTTLGIAKLGVTLGTGIATYVKSQGGRIH